MKKFEPETRNIKLINDNKLDLSNQNKTKQNSISSINFSKEERVILSGKLINFGVN